MTSTQRLPASLTPLEVALVALLRGLEPVKAVALPLREALGCIAADTPPLKAIPVHGIAAADGFALRARDLVGASSYTPLLLTRAPVWVEAGDRIPDDCDCVVDADAIEQSGPIIQVLAEAIPGQGARRIGGEIADGFAITPGTYFRPLDLLVAQAGGLETMLVRRPRLRIVNIPAREGGTATAELIVQNARGTGAEIIFTEAAARDAGSVARMLDASACDLLITTGGSGVGRTDATIAALAQCGEVLAHGVALQPGHTSAIGRIGDTPVIALSGAPDRALGAWWSLALPVLDRLSGRWPRPTMTLPLARKIASSVGIAEIAVLAREGDAWMPLAIGDLSLQAIARADAWLVVPGGSEGFAAGIAVDAYMLRE
jgi:molybdopterin molybdotransferase